MKATTHLWTSALAGGALALATHSAAPIAGALIGGFAIDSDHLIDQLWSISVERQEKNAPPADNRSGRGKLALVKAAMIRVVTRGRLLRLPLVFHSYELLAIALLVLAFDHSPFVTGLVIGYSLHLLLDLIRHHHEFQSPLFYFSIYRALHGFDRERLIKPQYL